ncbi:tellurite resistance TerB C-terminal domain-containing protein [Scytonema sp. NUACC26]|uniref:tellurite resistance TerB C-terminal domain-containing protein n=1 Tax=Scytonema sp. NUACC26 TaxID=3140176 RepID=UPI0034DB836C
MSSNRFIIGIIAFSVSFGLSLFLSWDFNRAFLTGLVTVPATYIAAFFVDKRRRNHEMLVLDSLQRRIQELEGLKFHIVSEIKQLEAHNALLYSESSKLQNQLVERRTQRDSFHRELSSFFQEKQKLEAELNYLQNQLQTLDKTKTDLNHSFSALNSEKRRLELNCNVSRVEVTNLQNQLIELQQQKQELESSLTLLNRLKPQLEEKLYELRVEIHEMEVQEQQQSQLLTAKKAERENIEASLNSLHEELTEQRRELEQLQGQVSLLLNERDQLQSQVWELLQQMETLTSDTSLYHNEQNREAEFFPFSELMDSLEPVNSLADNSEDLSEEWEKFVERLPNYEIQVLKAILEQENPSPTIKKIAEDNITMPNLLIDSINELARDTMGELLIDTASDNPTIYQEYITDVRKAIAIHQDMMARQTSRN